MKRIIFLAIMFVAFACLASNAAVNVGLSVSKGGNSFYLSIGNYFSVPQRDVMVVRQRKIPDDQIPVVFFIARHANVAPAAVMDLRLRGNSWMNITLHYGLNPEIYYVHVSGNSIVGGPYGHAYGFYNHRPRNQWNKIFLTDADIINLVNLRLLSEEYNYQPEFIIGMRRQNHQFNNINDYIMSHRNQNIINAHAAPARGSQRPAPAQAAPAQPVRSSGAFGHIQKNNAAPRASQARPAPAQAAPAQHQNHNGAFGQRNNNNAAHAQAAQARPAPAQAAPAQAVPAQQQKHSGAFGHVMKNNAAPAQPAPAQAAPGQNPKQSGQGNVHKHNGGAPAQGQKQGKKDHNTSDRNN